MAQSALSRSKIPTKNPQLTLVGAGNPAPARTRTRRAATVANLVTGNLRAGTRDQTLQLCPPDGRVVVEVAGGVTVYPAPSDQIAGHLSISKLARTVSRTSSSGACFSRKPLARVGRRQARTRRGRMS